MDNLSPAGYRALAQFRHQIRRFLHFSEEAARAEGLEPQQHQVLLAIQGLHGPEPPNVGELAAFLFLRHHSAVGLIDRLEERGLVERVRSTGDRRQVQVRLTAAGLEKLAKLSSVHRRELRTLGPRLLAALEEVLAPPPE